MDEQQKFQKPWQLQLLKVHKAFGSVVDAFIGPILNLDPTTQMLLAELNRKPKA